MACGKAVIATDTAGMRDYVKHGVNGILVPPGDPNRLAAEITALQSDPDRAKEMGRVARRVIEDEFNTRAQARRLAEILSSCG